MKYCNPITIENDLATIEEIELLAYQSSMKFILPHYLESQHNSRRMHLSAIMQGPECMHMPIKPTPIVWARNFAMYAMFMDLKMHKIVIGRHFKKDHTSVLHAIQQVNDLDKQKYIFKKVCHTFLYDAKLHLIHLQIFAFALA